MSDSILCIILISASYLIGSISSAILVTRIWTGKDIRNLGNGNAGAANVGRSVGILPASLVVIFDFSKGALPVLAGGSMGLSEGCALAGAVAAVLGHSYPIYFHFRGGKGLAAALGALLALTPWETFLVLPVLGYVYLVLTGSAVSGALAALLFLVGLDIWRGHPLVIILSPLVLLLAVGIGSLPEIIRG
jgi:glycerol-3-phosphate acyltransferase PlsY